jgi:hypothetical protein
MRKTLARLRSTPRMNARLFALIEWPATFRSGKRASTGAIGNATQRLHAATKAGLAHVAFERGEATYEISARGRAALSRRTE